MSYYFVFTALNKAAWSQHLFALRDALIDKEREEVFRAYAGLYRSLIDRGAASLLSAAAEDLLWQSSSLSRAMVNFDDVPEGIKVGALQDLDTLITQISRNWRKEAGRITGRTLPPLEHLSPVLDEPIKSFAQDLKGADTNWLFDRLMKIYSESGAGILARYLAFRWVDGGLQGIAHPVTANLSDLLGLETQLLQLKENTIVFLSGKPAHHTLLYGPRGSGKSTSIRGLLTGFHKAGLRLVEVSPADLQDLPDLLEVLRYGKRHYILFVDDLAFEAGDTGYQPLKTLLEGSLTERPDNVLVYATSNRRHLVKEQFSDRPDPLNDDVHAWDTQNERLALADRFGLTITFPTTTQKEFLNLVGEMVAREGLEVTDLQDRAVKFADWGNGYSGRTAQQFINSLKADLV